MKPYAIRSIEMEQKDLPFDEAARDEGKHAGSMTRRQIDAMQREFRLSALAHKWVRV